MHLLLSNKNFKKRKKEDEYDNALQLKHSHTRIIIWVLDWIPKCTILTTARRDDNVHELSAFGSNWENLSLKVFATDGWLDLNCPPYSFAQLDMQVNNDIPVGRAGRIGRKVLFIINEAAKWKCSTYFLLFTDLRQSDSLLVSISLKCGSGQYSAVICLPVSTRKQTNFHK